MNMQSFEPEIRDTYLGVHDWLASLPNTPDYRTKNIERRIEKLLRQEDLLSAAAQYYVLFPAHFFKVSHTLQHVIGEDSLKNWLKFNPRVCVVDVGCGAGSASAAFIDSIIKLKRAGAFTQPIEMYCIGVDVNKSAISLYNQFLVQLKPRLKDLGIDLQYNLIPHGNLQALNHLRDFLNQRRTRWGQPYLSQVFIPIFRYPEFRVAGTGDSPRMVQICC